MKMIAKNARLDITNQRCRKTIAPKYTSIVTVLRQLQLLWTGVRKAVSEVHPRLVNNARRDIEVLPYKNQSTNVRHALKVNTNL
jgi:hypothetical protein